MAIEYKEQYETRKARTEIEAEGAKYALEYIATGDIDCPPNKVDASIMEVAEDGETRIGYAYYSNGASSVRFNSPNSLDVKYQALISEQFYADLQNILELTE